MSNTLDNMKIHSSVLAKKLKNGEITVIPTDTIYGLTTSAFLPKSIERIYQIKKRNPEKPLIILLSVISDLSLFEIKIDKYTKKILETVWPGKVSVVLPCLNRRFHYLHRGNDSLAFRLPAKTDLKNLLKITGPLVSTSANPEGKHSAKTITKAREYFSNSVDCYIDEGLQKSLPSTLIEIKDGKVKILRQGGEKVKI